MNTEQEEKQEGLQAMVFIIQSQSQDKDLLRPVVDHYCELTLVFQLFVRLCIFLKKGGMLPQTNSSAVHSDRIVNE